MGKLPLRKQLTFGLVVAGAAFVTSALLGAITAGVPAAERTTPVWFIGMIVGAVAGTVYLLLSGNRAVRIADDAERARALIGPAAGRAQLLVVRQGYVGKLAGVDVLVDDAVVAQLKSPRFASLDLPVGRHEVVAQVQGKRTAPEQVELAANETAVLRIDMAIGRARLLRDRDVAAMRQTLATVPMVASA